MDYHYFKALHIIFMVTWFAGVWFMGRMLIYHKDANKQPEDEKEPVLDLLIGAARRTWYIIIIPSMTITILLGSHMAVQSGALRQGWFHFKLLFLILFILYNFYLNKLRKTLIKESCPLSTIKLRVLNEIPFLFLVIIVFTVYSRNFFSGIWAGGVLFGVSILIGFLVKLYKKRRVQK